MDKKNVKILWAVFILVIMVSSVIGFMYQPDETNEINDGSVSYNGFKFVNNNDLWILEKDGQSYYFTNLPEDVKGIEIPQILIQNQKQYFMYDYKDLQNNLGVISEKLRLVLSGKGVTVVNACIKEEDCPADWPIKDCSNDGFYFKISNESKVYKENKCYVLQGSLSDINKEVDKINYIIFGVFEE